MAAMCWKIAAFGQLCYRPLDGLDSSSAGARRGVVRHRSLLDRPEVYKTGVSHHMRIDKARRLLQYDRWCHRRGRDGGWKISDDEGAGVADAGDRVVDAHRVRY